MRAARIIITIVLLAGLAAPAVAPFLGLIRHPAAWSVWADPGRIGEQALNTGLLAFAAMMVAVPVGTAGGILLARIPFFGRRIATGIVILGMFIPLPVYAVAWQVILSGWVPNSPLAPGVVTWRPWTQGLLPAAWVHGTAAVPWVIAIVAACLATADRGLEEDALLTGGPRAAFRRVLIPRAIPAAAVGAMLVAVQCATEITVTDAMMVRTLAEEAYTQLAVGYAAGAAAASVATFPFLLAGTAVATIVVRRLGRILPAGSDEVAELMPLTVKRGTLVVLTLAAWSVCFVLAGLPLAAIIWKGAGGGIPGGADVSRLVETLGRLGRSDGLVLGESLLASAVAGTVAASLAWVSCGLALRSGWLAGFLLILCISLWLTPGPLIGFGLKNVFDCLMTVEDFLFAQSGVSTAWPPVRSLVYDQPSPVPVVWSAVIRLFPYAVAVVWPAMRAIPRDLLDLAEVDGLGVASFFRRVVAPVAVPAVYVAAIAVAALALGEVSAGKVVAPPGYRAFVLELFVQMHYGTDATVCGLCLSLLSAVAVPILVGIGFKGRMIRRRKNTLPSPDPTPGVRPE